VDPGQPPRKTAVIQGTRVVQWWLYYAAVLDPRELSLSQPQRQALAQSLEAYQQGGLLQALEAYPEGRTPENDDERIFHAALLLSVLAGPDPRDPISVDQPWPTDFRPDPSGAPLRGLRIAFSPDFGYGQVEPEIAELVASALPVFTSYGALVEHRDPSWANPGPFHRVIYHSGLAVRAEPEYEQHPEWVDEWLTEIVREGRGLSAVELKKAETERGRLYDSAVEFFTEFDLLITPQLPFTAWDAGSGRGRTTVGSLSLYPDYRRSFLCYPFNLTGQPAITLPCGWTAEGMPVGLQIVGRWHRDDMVLHVAAAFEAARPFADRWPQLA